MVPKHQPRVKKHCTLIVFLLIIGTSSCTNTDTNQKQPNHLQGTSSPYLKQHLYNPVDWYPWGAEALSKAKAEQKLLVVSIGFSACHWCHVMERESFSDTAVARLMNDEFVSIKVDREERADIDKMYSDAAKILTGNVGWPLNVIALPDGRPFFVGTYFAKSDWMDILQKVTQKYAEDPDRFEQLAGRVLEGMRQEDLMVVNASDSMMTLEELDQMMSGWLDNLDTINGGLKGQQKFPMPGNPEFLMAYYFHTQHLPAKAAAELWLQKMMTAGLYDHVGGGFFRYTTDSAWLVPHFEKMLYDNAQIVGLYARAYRMSKNPEYKQVVHQTLDFINRELTSDQGAFFTSLNAESEGSEGAYYTWSQGELNQILKADAAVFSDYFGVDENGNWKENQNILRRQHGKASVGETSELSHEEFEALIKSAKQRLLAKRALRERPSVDDKIITGWNALMISAYCEAYQSFGEADYLNAALKNAQYLRENAVQSSGSLRRNIQPGSAEVSGFLDDYAFLIKAYLDLYQVTFDERWITTANQLVDYTLRHFYDEKSGLFHYTSDQEAILVRNLEIQDGAIPSSNSQMARNLYRLGHLLKEASYNELATQMLKRIKSQMVEYGAYYANWALLSLDLIYPTYEVVIIGDQAEAFQREMGGNYLPDAILMGGKAAGTVIAGLQQKAVDGQTVIYVCQNHYCQRPVYSVVDALNQITEKTNNQLWSREGLDVN